MSNTFQKHFDSIIDPRIERCKKNITCSIFFYLLLVLCPGAEGWEDIEDFGRIKLDWLKKYGDFDAGIPKRHPLLN